MAYFRQAAQRSETDELERRAKDPSKRVSFGVKFLDDCLRMIQPDDIILLGARSGAGKTQFCTNMALRNALQGRKIHMIALEESHNSIEARIRFQLLSQWYWANSPSDRPELPTRLNYLDWQANVYGDRLEAAERAIRPYMADLRNLHTAYKQDHFGKEEMKAAILEVAVETDLIIIDHVHYFDFSGDNENKELKEIISTARQCALAIKKPIVLVGHLRKTNPKTAEVCPGMEEFHGSSDLYKIATKVVTLAPKGLVPRDRIKDKFDVQAYTYCRAAKCRGDSYPTWHTGVLRYSITRNEYEEKYLVGKLKNQGTEFEELEPSEYPWWAERPTEGMVPSMGK